MLEEAGDNSDITERRANQGCCTATLPGHGSRHLPITSSPTLTSSPCHCCCTTQLVSGQPLHLFLACPSSCPGSKVPLLGPLPSSGTPCIPCLSHKTPLLDIRPCVHWLLGYCGLAHSATGGSACLLHPQPIHNTCCLAV